MTSTYTPPVDARPPIACSPLPSLAASARIEAFLVAWEAAEVSERTRWFDSAERVATLGIEGKEAHGECIAAAWSRILVPQISRNQKNALHRLLTHLLEQRSTAHFTADAARVFTAALRDSPGPHRTVALTPAIRAAAKSIKARTPEEVVEEVRQASRALRSVGDVKHANLLSAKLPRVGVHGPSGLDLDFGMGPSRESYRLTGLRLPVRSGDAAWEAWRGFGGRRWNPTGFLLEGVALTDAPASSLTRTECMAVIALQLQAGVDWVVSVEGCLSAFRALLELETSWVSKMQEDYRYTVVLGAGSQRSNSWSDGWEQLTHHVAWLGDAAYESFFAELQTVLEERPELKSRIAWLTRDADMCHAIDGLRVAWTRDCDWYGADLHQRLHRYDNYNDRAWELEFRRALLRFGAGAQHALLPIPSSEPVPLLEALSAIPSVEVAAAFAGLQHKRSLKKFAVPYFKRWPELAKLVLGPMAPRPAILEPVYAAALEPPAPAKTRRTSAKPTNEHWPEPLRQALWRRKLPTPKVELTAMEEAPTWFEGAWAGRTLSLIEGSEADDVDAIGAVRVHDLLRIRDEDLLAAWSRRRLVHRFSHPEPIEEQHLLSLIRRAGPDCLGQLVEDAEVLHARGRELRLFVSPWVPYHAWEDLRSLSSALSRPWRDWVDAHPRVAAIGAIGGALTALRNRQKPRANACVWFLMMVHRSHPEAVTAAATELGVQPWLASALELCADGSLPPPARKPPRWLPSLPPLMDAKGVELDDAGARTLVEWLASTPPNRSPEGLAMVQEAFTASSRAAFVWALFVGWEQAGTPSKDSWVVDALGHMGDDSTIEALLPLVKAWPGQGQHKRAVRALSVFERIGTDLALSRLYHIGEWARFEGVQSEAGARMRAIAHRRGLSDEQLADRVVPTLGLDAGGSRVLDMGARSLVVGFSESLVPYVADEAGVRSASLRSRKGDDPIKAPRAIAAWQFVREHAKVIAKEQLHRLERAMVLGRRWSAAEFQQHLVGHPLMVHLVRGLVWAVFEGDAVQTLFMVAEDRTLFTADGEGLVLPDGALVGVPHPMHMSEAECASWGTVLLDYEVVQPITQVGRELFRLTPAEQTGGSRFEGVEVASGRFRGLTGRGWSRGEMDRNGVVRDYSIGGLAGCVTVLIEPGVETRAANVATQTITGVEIRGVGEVGVSEALRDLSWLTRSEV